MLNRLSSLLEHIKFKRDSVQDSAHALFFKKLLFAFFLFIVFYACILTVLSVKKNIETKVQQALLMLEKNNVNIVNPQISLFFPAVEFDALSHNACPTVFIENGKIALSLRNKEITLTGTLAEGTILTTIQLDALFSPTAASVRSSFKDVNLKNISDSLPLQTLLVINEGRVNLDVALDLQVQNFMPLLPTAAGTIKSTVEKAQITSYIPILKKSDIAGINGALELHVDKSDLPYCSVSFHSDVVSADITGTAKLNYAAIAQSSINLNSVIKIDKNDINQELTPPNTLNSILKNNEVRMKITGSFKSPKVNVL